MELEMVSPKPGCLSPPVCATDPEEKEISDEDDDDRNHKHRRRDTRSQSLEGDASEQLSTRSLRKRNRPFENGYSFKENDFQSRENWKSYERKHPGMTTFPRAPLDLNQRNRANQSFSGDAGLGWGRGRESRMSSTDLASQMFHQGSVLPSLLPGRRMPTVSNAQNASWGTFGLIPGMPIGGLDTLQSLGLQGTLRPPINPSMNMGIPLPRCRDFEERGFCLRGEMCPMEHGVNRIVVEDVQSLSQFNLPVSLPSMSMLGNAAGPVPGPGPFPVVSTPSSTQVNNKATHYKSSKIGFSEDGLNINGAFSGSDLYDPDQPLWNNDHTDTSTALLAPHSPKTDETDTLFGSYSSDQHLGRLSENTKNDHQFGSTTMPTVSSHGKNSSLRFSGSKSRIDMKKGTDLRIGSLVKPVKETMKDQDAPGIIQDDKHQGGIALRNIRRPSQKASRTLFVNGIPQANNKTNALFSHFRKFGEVIDIYIPSNSERAFVQFSKREEAEAALMAPDAVMGNRFIKLWWANRDRIPEDAIYSGNRASTTSHGAGNSSNPIHLSVANATKDSMQLLAPKTGIAHTSIGPDNSNSPKAASPPHKKLENIELLKEELRKKREMLDQKRNEFRRQLNKLEKVTGCKGEIAAKQGTKKPKLESAVGLTEDSSLISADAGVPVASGESEMTVTKNTGETVVSPNPKTSLGMTLQEPRKPKQDSHQLAHMGIPFPINKFKLDNRTTAFRIIPPLPAAFANVSVIKEHFSSYGDLSSVVLEESETQDGGSDDSETSKHCSAAVSFATRQSAEDAFVNGKCWLGHHLKFIWMKSNNANKEPIGRDKSPSGNEETISSKSSKSSKVAVEATECVEEAESFLVPVSCERESPEDKML